MGRRPCCNKEGLNRGGWTAEEDKILFEYIKANGEGKWNTLPTRAGLKRCGKSCRLRWLNYLRPDIRRGNITKDEEDLIIRLHNLLGNRWSLIAGRLPRRTDNEIKNYWNTNLSKKVEASKQSSHRDATEKSMPPFPAIKDGPIKLSPVKTTAFRCTKNFIQDHFNLQKIGTDAAGTVPSDSSDGSLAFMSGNENASSHLMDFCGGREMGIPDILCTDFPKNGIFDLCDFDKVEGGSVSFRSLSSL